ncbi:MAG: hypothetical protein LBC03_00805 [Nitrososphaerota archaeon]|jgi:hypothetical protein|nr:hypothetical protein [Nitrososphaerota archaeon]
MSECKDYWCEQYNVCNVKCGHCDKKEKDNADAPELQIILKRRADRLMDLSENYKKSNSQNR